MRTLYLECNAGISGDMLVAALLDLGADKEALGKALDSISAKGFTYQISRVSKAGVACCDFDVILDAEHENHDHDMEFLHGAGVAHTHEHEHEHEHEHCHMHEHEHEHCHEHIHDHQHEHCHEHEHEHAHEHCHTPHEHHHAHEHRGLPEVMEIINAVEMSEQARAVALKIFDIIADAESKAHAVAKDEVHFHEVGAIDSIVDIVAIAVCLDSLHIEEVIVPELCEGRGCVRCQHGVLPVPVPATANIMQQYGLNVRLLPVQGEFVTPTGAAAVAAIKTSDELPEQFKIKAIGLGAGKRAYDRPSILRAMLIEASKKKL
ncbi:MAG: LarC family nickel insertion protein [Phascolarctobacterium sp.]|uniref:LarC family nickel insertion protein n=1 Tax=Phascolarctobacterium sp. TaxID=2049039 RepID=UPI0026DAA593|nr:LarC family nickel insertion protein [Phascolarctobacterium sp.]MDO4921228.1 LarC family nickel insertion protein [Phascolarctobacterium sp.]